MEKRAFHYPLFKREDIDAFFALFQNNLANFVVIAVTMLGMGFPANIVFGKVIPGAAVAVIVGNLYYAHTANRLARQEQRTDVTALSYGISTPVMFVFLFGVLLPAKTITGDPELAWKIAVAAAFLSGAIGTLISLIGNWVRKNLPRPAMLGALSGVAISFIAGEMLFKTFEIPVVGLVSLAIILVGIVGKIRLPFNIPSTLLAMIMSTALAFLLKYSGTEKLSEAVTNIGFYPILPSMVAFEGLSLLFTTMSALLAVLLPITIYNAIETMNNVEAMAAAGDSYDVRECQAVDGIGTMLGALFGGAFPTTVYIATVGSKWMGAGRGYSILNAVVFFFAALFGLIAALAAVIPVPAIAPILVFVGVSMVATAYQTNETKYYMAIALASLPYLANYIMSRFNNQAGEVVANISEGIVPLGQGAMFSGIILGAITVFIIDRTYYKAVIFSLIGALFTFAGFMHAPALALNAAPDYTMAYVVMALFFTVCAISIKKDKPFNNPMLKKSA